MGSLTRLVFDGLGRHLYCVPSERIPHALKWSVISQICNNIGIGLCKISVCLCVLRIIDRARRGLTAFLWLVIAFAAASHLAQVILFVAQCRPMAALWNTHVHGKCFSPHITYLAAYIGFGLDAFTDLICAGIPIFILHRIQLSTRTKWALCSLMGLGSLTAGCAIAKAITLRGVFETDFTWGLWKPAICTIIEHLAGITLVSLPALKPLFDRILDITHARSTASKPYTRWPVNVSGDNYGLDKSLRSDYSGPTGMRSFEHAIVKTTDFRMGSEHASQISQQLEEYWPPPASSVNVATTERFERSNI